MIEDSEKNMALDKFNFLNNKASKIKLKIIITIFLNKIINLYLLGNSSFALSLGDNPVSTSHITELSFLFFLKSLIGMH